MTSTQDHDDSGLAPGTADVLQAATRVLAGVALRSLDALDSAVTLPQFRLLAVLADLGPAPSGQAARYGTARRRGSARCQRTRGRRPGRACPGVGRRIQRGGSRSGPGS